MGNARKSLGIVLAATILVGCGQGFNGAWRLNTQQKKEVLAYQKLKEARQQQKRTADMRQGKVDFDASAKEVSFAAMRGEGQPPAVGPAAGMSPRVEHNPNFSRAAAPSQLDMMRLYGDMPNASFRTASPLDSTENLAQVTFATEGADFDPAISPDGQMLVYASTRHRKTADIYMKRVDGTTVTQLTSDPANDVMPTFSPGGERVAFASNRSGNWDIYIVDVAGGQPWQVTNSPSDEVHPSFSPDGKRLVYCTYGSESGQWELVVIDVENPARKRFIGFGLFPEWSPVDDVILFQRARERGTRWFSVWTMQFIDGQSSRPTEIIASANAAAITPSWSPDGKHIVFATVINPADRLQNKPVQSDVWLVGIDGKGRANLTNSRFSDLQPIWSRNGMVYFVSNRGKSAVENVWGLRPDQALRVARPVDVTPGASVRRPAVPESGTNNATATGEDRANDATATATDDPSMPVLE